MFLHTGSFKRSNKGKMIVQHERYFIDSNNSPSLLICSCDVKIIRMLELLSRIILLYRLSD
jgi:hypothetical protein